MLLTFWAVRRRLRRPDAFGQRDRQEDEQRQQPQQPVGRSDGDAGGTHRADVRENGHRVRVSCDGREPWRSLLLGRIARSTRLEGRVHGGARDRTRHNAFTDWARTRTAAGDRLGDDGPVSSFSFPNHARPLAPLSPTAISSIRAPRHALTCRADPTSRTTRPPVPSLGNVTRRTDRSHAKHPRRLAIVHGILDVGTCTSCPAIRPQNIAFTSADIRYGFSKRTRPRQP